MVPLLMQLRPPIRDPSVRHLLGFCVGPVPESVEPEGGLDNNVAEALALFQALLWIAACSAQGLTEAGGGLPSSVHVYTDGSYVRKGCTGPHQTTSANDANFHRFNS